MREAVRSCDIVVDQLIGGYGLAAVEAMSARKPVLSNLSWMDTIFRESEALRHCPIVDTTAETLDDRLRMLVDDPELRARLGAEGREYVGRYHSLEAVGRVWAEIFAHVWQGAPHPAQLSGSQIRE